MPFAPRHPWTIARRVAVRGKVPAGYRGITVKGQQGIRPNLKTSSLNVGFTVELQLTVGQQIDVHTIGQDGIGVNSCQGVDGRSNLGSQRHISTI